MDARASTVRFPETITKVALPGGSSESRDTGLEGWSRFVHWRRGQWRRRKVDGGDFLNDDLAPALLVDLGVEDVLSRDDEFGFWRLRWRWGAVREIADDAGGGGSGFFVLGRSRRKAEKRD